MEKGMAAGKKAVKLDNHSSIAHYVLGLSYVWAEQFQAAISEVEISLQLNPYNAQAQRGLVTASIRSAGPPKASSKWSHPVGKSTRAIQSTK